MIAKVRDNNFDEVCALIDRLFEIAKSNNSLDIVRQMKCIVPEFKSQNSIYEQLDVERTPTTN